MNTYTWLPQGTEEQCEGVYEGLLYLFFMF